MKLLYSILLVLFYFFLLVSSEHPSSTPSSSTRSLDPPLCARCHSAYLSSMDAPRCDMHSIYSGMMLSAILNLQLNALAHLHFGIFPYNRRGYYASVDAIHNVSVSMHRRAARNGNAVSLPPTWMPSNVYEQYRDDPRRPSVMSVEEYYSIRNYLDSSPPLRSHGRTYGTALDIANIDRHNRHLPLVNSDHIFDRYFTSISSTTGGLDYVHEDIVSRSPVPGPSTAMDPTLADRLACADVAMVEGEFDAFNPSEFVAAFRNTASAPCVIDPTDLADVTHSSPVPFNGTDRRHAELPFYSGDPVIDLNDEDYTHGLSTLRNYFHDASNVLLEDRPLNTPNYTGVRKRDLNWIYCKCKSYDFSDLRTLVRDSPILLNVKDRLRSVDDTTVIFKLHERVQHISHVLTLHNGTVHDEF